MTAVLLWKEYRQQRAFWLAVAFSAVLLVVGLGESFSQGSLWQVFHDESMAEVLNFVVAGLGLIYGVVSGALLLAGESDAGTLVFLDNLTGQRGPLFVRKLLAGVVLTLSLSVFLAGLALALGFGSWKIPLLLPLLGLDGLVWGLLAGALCRKVLVAGLVGMAFLAVSWPLAGVLTALIDVLLRSTGLEVLEWHEALSLFIAKLIVDSAGGILSWRIYCRDDLARQAASPLPGRVLFWLALRQGRWILIAGLAIALLLASTVNWWPPIVWPVGSLLLGLAFGLAVFILDQREASRFLGAQRFPLGRIWTVKILFWATALLALTTLAWFGGALYHGHTLFSPVPIGPYTDTEQYNRWSFLEMLAGDGGSPWLVVGLWPLYGFCFGQFFGQIVQRPVLAVVLALFFTPLAISAWLPALVFGGLPLWQVLIIPVLLLLTTRLAMWPWLSERLLSARPLFGIAAAVTLMVLSVIGCRWYRAIEVPDMGEPFNVQAYASSPLPAGPNEPGRLIRMAGAALEKQREQVDKRFFYENDVANRDTILFQLSENGWPEQNEELSRWLDQVFAGEWVRQAEEAAALPLGPIQDSRHIDTTRFPPNWHLMGALFALRALQQQAHDDPRGALHELETLLALSRHMRNDASPSFNGGCHLEQTALHGFRSWLQNSGSDKELLRTALTVLQQHEAKIPNPAYTIKVAYLIDRRDGPAFQNESPLANELFRLTYQVPGERERHRRILNAIVSGQLRAVQEPYWEIIEPERPKIAGNGLRRFWKNWYSLRTEWVALPPKDGPGSQLSAMQWGELISQFLMTDTWNISMVPFIERNLQSLKAAELATAAAWYQADHGKPPDQLNDLVPTYLTTLPDDPYTGQPFLYRIDEKNRKIKGIVLTPGQAYVMSQNSKVFYPLPPLPRKENKP